ncbi:hypothetical protein [Jannaschia sp. M317]|uniref:hypothetical protein n=1 Tax=Jannaschia sp. M317 TaxID=2867011 RepID=UPI0021A3E934|nr:hypothetical protein [Jannaschia sp. M317]UWQ16219.1 hypothetical protein K3551_09765 [Jannaschia sp. M317]
MTKIMTATLWAVLGAGAALAMGHATWDTDGDGALSPVEFRMGVDGLGVHGGFDADGSGLLGEAEWDPLAEIGDHVNMDLNGDGGVDSAEFGAVLFNRYDTDGSATIDATEIGALDADLAAGGLLAQ